MGTELGSITANELNVAGEARLYETLRGFWHPVAYTWELDDRPKPVVLMDESLVLARLGGAVRAFRDRCLHRGAALSLGSVEGDELRCPYHGWTYGPDGLCTRIPAPFDSHTQSSARLWHYSCCEQDGLIWVCLANEARFPVPDFPEFSDPTYQTVAIPPYDWDCSAPRRLENFVDFAHFAWVHDGLLGSRDHPEVPEHEIWREGAELRFFQTVLEPLEGATKEDLNLDVNTVEVENAYRLTLPLSIYLNRRFPGENHYILTMNASPVSARCTRSFSFISRNYAFDKDDQKFVDFERVILRQDQPVVESQRPEELPFDLSAELHIRGVDKVSLEYRKWLVELTNSPSNDESRAAVPAARPHP